MSFNNKNLSVLAFANGFTLWHYHCKNDVDVSCDYFKSACELLKQGDLIIVNVLNNDTKTQKNNMFFVHKSINKKVILKPAFE